MPDFHIWFVKDESLHKSRSGIWGRAGWSPPSFPEDYELVAHVETPTHTCCFAIMQHHDNEAWQDRKEVRRVKDGPCRSMSVDDVVQSTKGESWIAKNYGWERIRHGN